MVSKMLLFWGLAKPRSYDRASSKRGTGQKQEGKRCGKYRKQMLPGYKYSFIRWSSRLAFLLVWRTHYVFKCSQFLVFPEPLPTHTMLGLVLAFVSALVLLASVHNKA